MRYVIVTKDQDFKIQTSDGHPMYVTNDTNALVVDIPLVSCPATIVATREANIEVVQLTDITIVRFDAGSQRPFLVWDDRV